VFLAFTIAAAAQGGQQPPAPQPVEAAAAAAPQPGGVTVEGCLVREVDVPGRQPLEQDRARVIQENNYVLTNTTVTQGTALADAPRPLMYKVRDLKKGDLRNEVGRRVQIEGKFDKVNRARNDVGFMYDLVELRGTALRRIAETCPGK
jgi:hypothetical protein